MMFVSGWIITEQSFASLWGHSYLDVEYLSRLGVKSRVMIARQLLFFRIKA